MVSEENIGKLVARISGLEYEVDALKDIVFEMFKGTTRELIYQHNSQNIPGYQENMSSNEIEEIERIVNNEAKNMLIKFNNIARY